MRRAWPALAAAALLAAQAAWAAPDESMRRSMDRGLEMELTYPETVAAGRAFAVSVLVENRGWEDKGPVVFEFDPGVFSTDNGTLWIDRVAEGGSYGGSVEFRAPEGASGLNYINLEYTQILVQGGVPFDSSYTDIAIPVRIEAGPSVDVRAEAPASIFADAEFPLTVELEARSADVSDVSVSIEAPAGAGLAGGASHSISTLRRGEPAEVEARIATPPAEVARERAVQFLVTVEYTDDRGERSADTHAASTVLRPRTPLEITPDGGVWIGGFFVAPYVSVGTLVGAPAGALLSLALRRRASRGAGR